MSCLNFLSNSEVEQFKKLNKTEWQLIAEELIMYEVHIFDRFLSVAYDEKKRDYLFDQIILSIGSALNEGAFQGIKEYPIELIPIDMFTEENIIKMLKENNILTSKFLTDNLNARQEEYSKFTLEYNKDKVSGYLPWEFGEKIASLLGKHNNAAIIFPIQICVMRHYYQFFSIKTSLDKIS